jgi:deoxycytidine triphosphate deaminase
MSRPVIRTLTEALGLHGVIDLKFGTEWPELRHWPEPPDKHLTPAYWHDPWPKLQGMLTAEYIVKYHERIGGAPPDAPGGDERGMIRPLQSHLLKPAGYELTLGARCLVQGEEVLLSEREPALRIPKNAVAFVSMEQALCLPHYVVASFDLTIELIYRGLLLGTGPQVDPGYQGGLSCPLHNISDDEIEIRLGDPFAKMDFVKTVPRDPEVLEQLAHIDSEEELVSWLRSGDAPKNLRLFKGGEPPWREPIFGYLNGRRPRSSLRQISDEVSENNETVERLRRYSYVSILAVVVGVAALIFAALQLSDGLTSTNQELQRLRACEQSLDYRLEALRRTPASSQSPVTISAPCVEP